MGISGYKQPSTNVISNILTNEKVRVEVPEKETLEYYREKVMRRVKSEQEFRAKAKSKFL